MTFNMYVTKVQKKWFDVQGKEKGISPKELINGCLAKLSKDLDDKKEIQYQPLDADRTEKMTIGMDRAQFSDLRNMASDARLSKTRITFTALKLYQWVVIEEFCEKKVEERLALAGDLKAREKRKKEAELEKQKIHDQLTKDRRIAKFRKLHPDIAEKYFPYE